MRPVCRVGPPAFVTGSPMIDLFIVLAFVAYAIGVGLYTRRAASQNLQEYFLAGKTLSGWRAGLSMAATQFAADTPLLVTGLIATAGVFALWRLWVYGLAFLLLAFVLAVGWRRGGVLTDAELTEARYSGRGVLGLRVLKAFYYGTVINCVVLAMVLVAAVRIAEVFLPWHEWLPGGVYGAVIGLVSTLGLHLGDSVTGLAPDVATANNLITIALILAFVATYSTTGGLRAVVATDVVQFILAMLGTLVYAWVAVDAAGGLGGLGDRIAELYGNEAAHRMLSFGPPDTTGEILLPFLVIIGLQWLFQMNSDGTGYLAQRAMACRTDRAARTAGVVFTWVQIFARSLLWLVIAVALLVLYPFSPEELDTEGFAASREILFVTGIDEHLPAGVRGLMLVGLLAALASTVDTHLNWGASYWSNDIYDRLVCRHWLRREPRGRELVLVARLSNLLILAIALLITAHLGSIQTAWSISLLFGAGMGLVLVLRWLWERINLYAELGAMAASLVTAPLLLYHLGTAPETEWLRLGLMALVTTVVAIGAALLTPRTDDQVLVSFYERVQPFGFWGATARVVGDHPQAPLRALIQRLAGVAAAGGSVFLLLLGIGQLLIRSPGADTFWSWLAIAAGLALIPVWWRALRQADAEGERTLRPRDIRGSPYALLERPGGLLIALRQLAGHLKAAYAMDLQVTPRGLFKIEEGGQRSLLFEVVQSLLICLARRRGVRHAQVILSRNGRDHVVAVRLFDATVDASPGAGLGAEIERLRERLDQVEGRLMLAPEPARVSRLVIRTAIEGGRPASAP